MTFTASGPGSNSTLWRPAQSAVLDRERLAEARLVGDHALEHAPAAARRRLPHELGAAAGQPSSSSTTWPKPSIHAGQRCGSYQSASASEASPGTRDRRLGAPISRRTSPRIASIEAAIRSSRGPSSPAAGALLAPRLGDAVEAPRAPLGVLPLAGDQALRLERAQQRVHRVRVHASAPPVSVGDALDQLVAVGRRSAERSAGPAAAAGPRGAGRRSAGRRSRPPCRGGRGSSTAARGPPRARRRRRRPRFCATGGPPPSLVPSAHAGIRRALGGERAPDRRRRRPRIRPVVDLDPRDPLDPLEAGGPGATSRTARRGRG